MSKEPSQRLREELLVLAMSAYSKHGNDSAIRAGLTNFAGHLKRTTDDSGISAWEAQAADEFTRKMTRLKSRLAAGDWMRAASSLVDLVWSCPVTAAHYRLPLVELIETGIEGSTTDAI